MTVLNFPTSPSNGDTYEENNVVYTWNGSYWSANNASDLGNVYVAIAGDRMTGNLELPGGGGETAALQKQEIQLLIDAGGGGGSGPTDLYWERDAGALSPKVSTDNVNIGDGNILLDADGTATFNEEPRGGANTGIFVDGPSGAYVASATGTNAVLRGFQTGGSESITLKADGSAFFSGGIDQQVPTDTTSLVNSFTRAGVRRWDYGMLDGANFAVGIAGQTDPVMSLFSGAAAQNVAAFYGDVLIGGTLPDAPNIELKPDGFVATTGTLFNTELNGPNIGVLCYAKTTADVSIFNAASDNGGTANPAFNVSSLGVVSARNTTIQSISSERRLKENIVAIDADTAWETIKSTPYYTYNFIGSDAITYGPMADEVPDEMIVQPMEENEAGVMVARSDEEGPIRTYDNGMLQARLYTALQTALTRIEALEAKVQALKDAA